MFAFPLVGIAAPPLTNPVGRGTTGMFLVAVPVLHPAVTWTVSVTEPEAGAVKEIELVFAPELIVPPPVSVQEYDAPLTVVTVAFWVDEAQAVDGALMAGVIAGQLPTVTVTDAPEGVTLHVASVRLVTA